MKSFKLCLQDVSDPAVMVAFPLLGDVDGASLVAWTTTPWTLPSNLVLCVNANLTYTKVRFLSLLKEWSFFGFFFRFHTMCITNELSLPGVTNINYAASLMPFLLYVNS